MPTHVRLKFRDKDNKCTTDKVAELAFGKFNVPFTRIFPTTDGFKAICRNDQDTDKLLTADAMKQFKNIGLNVYMPPEFKAKRTLFARKVDVQIGKHTPTQILAEIEDKNDGLKVTEIIKIKDYTHVFKVIFSETAMADKAKRQGLHLFNLSITPDQLEYEKFINVLTCFKCYTFNDHSTANCPNKSLTICSECAETGHIFSQCKSQVKSCINCKKEGKPYQHRTLAMACPIKKQLIKQQEQKEKEQKEMKKRATYATALKTVINETAPQPKQTIIQLSQFTHQKILTAVIHAHIMNICHPGSYEKELNDMLTFNNLPTIKVPTVPDSTKLFQAVSTPEIQQDIEQYTNPAQMTEMETETEEGAVGGANMSDYDISTDDTETEEERPPKQTGTKKKKANTTHDITPEITSGIEAGITFYVSENDHIPTKDIKLDQIITNIERERYKWTHEEYDWHDLTVYELIKAGKVKIKTSSFKKVTAKEFKKIKNGKRHQPTPEHQPATKRTRTSTKQ